MALTYGVCAVTGCINHPKAVTSPAQLNTQEDKSSPLADKNMSPEDRAQHLVGQLSLPQKIQLVTGVGFSLETGGSSLVPGAAGATYAVPQLGIPSIVLADGPAGVRINPKRANDPRSYYATAFPVATVLASTWNTGLVEEVGTAMGNEAKAYGVDILLGPGMNIQMNPLGGRNYEYFSEDPLVTGKMAAAIVRGVQSRGVGATVKHFVANNLETNRLVLNAEIDERALREIYLKGFEIAVRESKPWAVMSSYNKLNGTYTSQNKSLLIDILRDEWGFDGMIMTDWFSGDDSGAQMTAGNDLLMPGVDRNREEIRQALQDGSLSEADIDRNLVNILGVVFRSLKASNYEFDNNPDLQANAGFARQAATEGVVLLKNTNKTLPIPGRSKVAVFGITSYDVISGGTGSGDVNEAYTVSLVQALESQQFVLNADLKKQYETYLQKEKAKRPPRKNFFDPHPSIPEMKISAQAARRWAKSADIAIFTLGRNSGEFNDRKIAGDFDLTPVEHKTINIISKAFHRAGKKVVALLNIGNVIETSSWKDKVDAIVVPWQGGQEAGNAMADVLSGAVNPSGKLPVTFPNRYADVPSAKNFPGRVLSETILDNPYVPQFPRGMESEMRYLDSVFVGYRYYDSFKKDVSYPFGCGQSYTQFTLSDLMVTMEDNSQGRIDLKVTNTGSVAGKEVVQLYVTAPQSGRLQKPKHELKAFQKTRLLAANESQDVHLNLSAESLASFDDKLHQWVVEPGEYMIRATNCSRNPGVSSKISVGNEQTTSPSLTPLPPSQSILSPYIQSSN